MTAAEMFAAQQAAMAVPLEETASSESAAATASSSSEVEQMQNIEDMLDQDEYVSNSVCNPHFSALISSWNAFLVFICPRRAPATDTDTLRESELDAEPWQTPVAQWKQAAKAVETAVELLANVCSLDALAEQIGTSQFESLLVL
jgi:hypothetical protein